MNTSVSNNSLVALVVCRLPTSPFVILPDFDFIIFSYPKNSIDLLQKQIIVVQLFCTGSLSSSMCRHFWSQNYLRVSGSIRQKAVFRVRTLIT